MKSSVRVVVVGDHGVGKTSLITVASTEQFKEQVAPTLAPIRITESGPEKLTLTIVDTNPDEGEKILAELKLANAVVIVYAADDPATRDSIRTRWLPLIRSSQSRIPAVVVGNKMDTRTGDFASRDLQTRAITLMNENPEIESCIECSAKEVFNVYEVFFFAQNTVVYPMSPLFDVREQKLKPAADRALRRIFTLCDKDKDGTLNDAELNQFQILCFGSPLKPEEIDCVKRVVREGCPEGIGNNGLNANGFVFLHTLFIHRTRLDTTWTVVRKFGYDEELNLVLTPLPKKKGPNSETFELSADGINFLKEVFTRFDADRDGALNEAELLAMWAVTPGSLWGSYREAASRVPVNGHGYITQEGFLAHWMLSAVEDAETAAKYLHYFSYPHFFEKPYTCIKTRKKTKVGLKNRTSVTAYVIGARQTGKSSLLDAFIGRPLKSQYQPTKSRRTVAAPLHVPFQERLCCLLATEIPFEEAEAVVASADLHNNCDVACLIFDPMVESSWDYVARIQEAIHKSNKKIPCIFVATKDDTIPEQARDPASTDTVRSTYERVESKFNTHCADTELPTPVPISSAVPDLPRHLLTCLAETAVNPSVAWAAGAEEPSWSIRNSGAALITVTVAISVGFWLWRRRQTAAS